jgi:uncharacterized protein (TIGR02453 family)
MHIPALLQFLKELSENNNRPWFLHNKPNYDILREEFTELVADIIQRIAKFDDRIEHVDPKKSLFRIYRDVRFSANKDPYKTQFSAMIGEKKDHKAVPGYYFQINHEGVLGMGGGVYMPEPPTLNKIRHDVLTNPERITAVLKNKRFIATYGGIAEEDRMMRAPKGYQHLPADHPLLDQIKNRHFFGFMEINLKKHKSKDLAAEIAGNFEDLYPLISWLREVLE